MFAIKSLLIPANQLRGAPWINGTLDLCRSSLRASSTFRIGGAQGLILTTHLSSFVTSMPMVAD